MATSRCPAVPGQAATLQALAACAAVYATRARGDGTRRTYRPASRTYEAWCGSLGQPPLAGDPETVAIYAVHAADRSLSKGSQWFISEQRHVAGRPLARLP